MIDIFDELLSQNAIGADTVISAWYSSRDNAGRFVKLRDEFKFLSLSDTPGYIVLTQIYNNQIFKINANNIITIDGMIPTRYSAIYDINPDGSYKQVGKKRGRKAKEVN